MRAVGLFEHGGPEVLQVVELPSVDAGPGQVRIRNHAAAVNPTLLGESVCARRCRRRILLLKCLAWMRPVWWIRSVKALKLV